MNKINQDKAMLLTSYKLNNTIRLKNRIVMAPMTRSFADEHLVPTDDIAEYYSRRADAGLIITEATVISPQAQGYPNTPGIYTQEQISGWKKVTDAVHAGGGKIFSQIWHTGRVSHSIYQKGGLPVAPSAVKLDGRVPRTENLSYEEPRALSIKEIKQTVLDFKQAAINAIEAGFDGIEIHGANGYLIDQFLHQETNLRDDQYGGSIENRTRFALEIVNEVIAAVGAHRTGIRLSPAAYFNMRHTKGDEETFISLLENLNPLDLAYVHVGMFDDNESYNYLGGRVSRFIRAHYEGNVIGAGSYTIDSASKDIEEKEIDLASIGRPFIANPDLIEKIKSATQLVPYDENMLLTLI